MRCKIRIVVLALGLLSLAAPVSGNSARHAAPPSAAGRLSTLPSSRRCAAGRLPGHLAECEGAAAGSAHPEHAPPDIPHRRRRGHAVDRGEPAILRGRSVSSGDCKHLAKRAPAGQLHGCPPLLPMVQTGRARCVPAAAIRIRAPCPRGAAPARPAVGAGSSSPPASHTCSKWCSTEGRRLRSRESPLPTTQSSTSACLPAPAPCPPCACTTRPPPNLTPTCCMHAPGRAARPAPPRLPAPARAASMPGCWAPTPVNPTAPRPAAAGAAPLTAGAAPTPGTRVSAETAIKLTAYTAAAATTRGPSAG